MNVLIVLGCFLAIFIQHVVCKEKRYDEELTYRRLVDGLVMINRKSVSRLSRKRDWIEEFEDTNFQLNTFYGFFLRPFELCLALELDNIVEYHVDYGNYNVQRNHLLYFDFFDFKPLVNRERWKKNVFSSECERKNYEIEYDNRVSAYENEFTHTTGKKFTLKKARDWFGQVYEVSVNVAKLHAKLGKDLDKRDYIETGNKGKTIEHLLRYGSFGRDGISLIDFRKIIPYLPSSEIYYSTKVKHLTSFSYVDYDMLFLSLHDDDIDSFIKVMEYGVFTFTGKIPRLDDRNPAKIDLLKHYQQNDVKDVSNCLLLSMINDHIISKSISYLPRPEENCELEEIKKHKKAIQLFEEKVAIYIPEENQCWKDVETSLTNEYKQYLSEIGSKKDGKDLLPLVEFIKTVVTKMKLDVKIEDIDAVIDHLKSSSVEESGSDTSEIDEL